METSTVIKLDTIHARFNDSGGNIISALQDIQSEFGYIPEDTVYWFSDKTGIPASKFFGVATFYSQFYLKPRGKNIVTACCGTACHVKGSDRIIFRLQDKLSLAEDEDTTSDGLFTLEKVACVGACSIAPVMLVNKKVYGKMTPDKMVKELKTYEEDSGE